MCRHRKKLKERKSCVLPTHWWGVCLALSSISDCDRYVPALPQFTTLPASLVGCWLSWAIYEMWGKEQAIAEALCKEMLKLQLRRRKTKDLEMFIFNCFLKYFIYLFLERGQGREKEREGNINMWEKHWLVASCIPLTRNLGNPDMCPDRGSNRWPWGSQAGTQSTEPCQPGLFFFFFLIYKKCLRWLWIPMQFLKIILCVPFIQFAPMVTSYKSTILIQYQPGYWHWYSQNTEHFHYLEDRSHYPVRASPTSLLPWPSL